jgi:hypothetical protein
MSCNNTSGHDGHVPYPSTTARASTVEFHKALYIGHFSFIDCYATPLHLVELDHFQPRGD